MTLLLCVLLVVIILLVWMEYRPSPTGTEKMGNEPSVDMVDFRHSDPKYSKYSRRMRDSMGMNASDYYYENNMLHNSSTIDFQELYGDRAFEAIEGFPNNASSIIGGVPGQRGAGPTASRFIAEDGGFADLGSIGSAEPAVGGLSDLEKYQKAWPMDGNMVLPDL